MKKNTKKIYNLLQSKRKKIKKRSIILIAFLFGVNAYAWFIYMSNASTTIESSVSAWNVNFYDGSEEVKELTINTGDLRPGMTDFTKDLIVKNNSDMQADFIYEVDKASLLGVNIMNNIHSEMNAMSFLDDSFPFKTKLTASKTVLENDDTMTFNIKISWPYEAVDNFYKLNSIYEFDPSFTYYIFDGVNYNSDNTVSESNFLAKVNMGLYLESDDADTYFGERCKSYKESSGNNYCYTFHVKLKAVQKNG